MNNIDTSTWHKFKLSDLFEISTTKSTDKNKIVFKENGIYDFIGRSSINYGIQGKVDFLGYEPNEENTFSVVQIGETCCLFRENKWYASQNIFKLTPKNNGLIKCQLYISAIMNKLLSPYKDAYVYPTLDILKNMEIALPATEKSEPDWNYMADRIKELEADRIKELEADRIKELEAYLVTTGLNDYELTDEDKKILSLSLSQKGLTKLDIVKMLMEFEKK